MPLIAPRYTAIAQTIMKNWYPDSCEVRLEVDITDAYGTVQQSYPQQSPPVFYRGHLREVERIPGINQEAGDVFTVGNFIIHLEADAIITEKAQIIVNGGDTYQVENVYQDKANRFSTQCYCYRVK